MSIISIDPTLLVDTIKDMCDDDRFKYVGITGISELDKVDLYTIILQNIEGTGIKYGHMVNDNMIVMAVEHVEDYLNEVIESILESTGVEEFIMVSENTGSTEQSMDIDEFESKYYEGLFTDVEDESEAFRNSAEGKDINVAELLSEFLQCALEDSAVLITGGYKEIEANIISW